MYVLILILIYLSYFEYLYKMSNQDIIRAINNLKEDTNTRLELMTANQDSWNKALESTNKDVNTLTKNI